MSKKAKHTITEDKAWRRFNQALCRLFGVPYVKGSEVMLNIDPPMDSANYKLEYRVIPFKRGMKGGRRSKV